MQKCYHMQHLLKTHWHTIFQDQCIQHAISILFFGGTSIFADLGNRGHPTVRILHMKIHYGHTTSCPLPSPPTYDSLSLLISPSNGAISTVLSHLLFNLFLLNSNEKVVVVSSALYFWDHHTQIQTHRSTGHCTFTFTISKPCAKAWGLQKPGPWRFITT